MAKGTAPSDILARWSSQASGGSSLRSSHTREPSVAFLVSSLFHADNLMLVSSQISSSGSLRSLHFKQSPSW